MEYAKKMALVDPRLLERLQQRPQGSMAERAMVRLDNAMEDILNRQDVPEDAKVKLYQQVLQRHLTYDDKREPAKVQLVVKRPALPSAMGELEKEPLATQKENEMDSIEEEIVESAPKNAKSKVQLLLKRMKQDPNLGWTERGELMVNGSVIPNTQINDLVQDVLRKRKNYQPRGWETFARALAENNVPQDLVGNLDRWHYIQRQVGEQRMADLGKWAETPFKTPATQAPSSRRKKKLSPMTPVPLRWDEYT